MTIPTVFSDYGIAILGGALAALGTRITNLSFFLNRYNVAAYACFVISYIIMFIPAGHMSALEIVLVTFSAYMTTLLGLYPLAYSAPFGARRSVKPLLPALATLAAIPITGFLIRPVLGATPFMTMIETAFKPFYMSVAILFTAALIIGTVSAAVGIRRYYRRQARVPQHRRWVQPLPVLTERTAGAIHGCILACWLTSCVATMRGFTYMMEEHEPTIFPLLSLLETISWFMLSLLSRGKLLSAVQMDRAAPSIVTGAMFTVLLFGGLLLQDDMPGISSAAEMIGSLALAVATVALIGGVTMYSYSVDATRTQASPRYLPMHDVLYPTITYRSYQMSQRGAGTRIVKTRVISTQSGIPEALEHKREMHVVSTAA